MFRTLALRAAQTVTENATTSARSSKPMSAYVQRMIRLHPAKKVWPPEFKRLSAQEQLRFEKKYKRRLTLATARPRWIKFTKLAQLFTITIVIIYSVLFMEAEPQPFDNFRKWFWNGLGLDYVPYAKKKTTSSLPQARS